MMLFAATIACLALGATSNPTKQEDKLLITVLTEAYCPTSIRYLEEQIIPVYKQYHRNITLEICPFGNAVQWYEDGEYKFECEFGPKECLSNKLHACAIQQVCGEGGTKECSGGVDAVIRVLGYIDCMDQDEDQEGAHDRCATAMKLKPEPIAKCARGKEGDRLHSMYGNRTATFNEPPVKDVGVPYLAFDGVANNEEVLKSPCYLSGAVCKAKPHFCGTS